MGVIDTTFKELAKTSFPELLSFLIPGIQGGEVVELPQELPITIRSVDLLLKALQHPLGGRRLLIMECQVQEEKDLQKLLLLRASLAHFYYDLPVSTLLLALTPRAVVPESYTFAFLRELPVQHGVEVRRLYEEPAELALETAPPAILPLCPVMRPSNGDRSDLLEKVLLRIAQLDLPSERRQMLLTWASTFATLHLAPVQVRLITNELSRRRPYMLQPLRDLPLLRDTYQEGKTDGKAEGKAEDLLELLADRNIAVSDEVRRRILSCGDTVRLARWFRRALRASTLEEILD